MKKILAGTFMLTLMGSLQLNAAEYFASRQGSDTNDGLTKERSFLTVQKGVDALQPGDTLTIGPGEYSEHVRRENLGDTNKETLIRAEIPGTVLLRGDVDAPALTRVQGYQFVYAADFDRDVQSVNEVDTLVMFPSVPSMDALEFQPGSFYYDAAAKKVYLSTSDLQPVDRHRYTVSVIKDFGFFLKAPCRVTIEGIAASGFNSSTLVREPALGKVFGLFIDQGRHCAIRRCTAFLNGGGIGLRTTEKGWSNRVEFCRAYGSYSRFSMGGGNIVGYEGNHDVIQNCYAYKGDEEGIFFYAGSHGPLRMVDNLAWGHLVADIRIKASNTNFSRIADRCVALGNLFTQSDADKVTHCLLPKKDINRDSLGADNIALAQEPDLDVDREFADPRHLDFRLQATSRFRKTGPEGADRGAFAYEANVFYVTPAGDDGNDGLSVTYAWKSLARAFKALRPGDTLYLEGGTYSAEGGFNGGDVKIRSRGVTPVILKGPTEFAGRNLLVERVYFTDEVRVAQGSNVCFNNCTFAGKSAGLRAESTVGLRLTHNVFYGPARMKECSLVFASGNLFAAKESMAAQIDRIESVMYSDYNSYPDSEKVWQVGDKALSFDVWRTRHDAHSKILKPEVTGSDGYLTLANRSLFVGAGPLGEDIGHFDERRTETIRVAGPTVHSVSDTTANLEWWISAPGVTELAWGKTPECLKTNRFKQNGYFSYSLTGLQPGTRYYYQLKVDLSSTPLPGICPPGAVEIPATGVLTTAPSATPARVYYVALDGDDARDGIARGTAWKTLNHAAGQVNAGDTVLVAGGTYTGTVWLRATGEKNRPITFKAIPGETVNLDGSNRALGAGFILTGKNHYRFDGFYMFGFGFQGGVPSGGFLLSYCNDVQLTRIFFNGRGAGYAPAILDAFSCDNLLLKNSVVSRTFGGLHVAGCPNLTLENNVFLRNLISAATLENAIGQKMVVRKNIFTDGLPIKVTVPVMSVGAVESLEEADNCYYLRVPDSEKKMFAFYGGESYARCARAYGWSTNFTKPPVFDDLTKKNLKEYQAQFGNSGSVVADPRFQGSVELKGDAGAGKAAFTADWLADKKENLDFPDLFATDPEIVKKGIGLIPDDFKDFNFERPPTQTRGATNH